MADQLKQLYWMMLLPVVAGLFVLILLDRAGLLPFNDPTESGLLAPFLFTTAALFSLGLPTLFRSVIAHRHRHRRQMSRRRFLRFERHLICIALVTPYVALMAQAFKLPGFHQAGIALMALYAAYYFYPSRKRILFEKNVFRVDVPLTLSAEDRLK